MRLSVCKAETTAQLLIDLKKIYQPYLTDEQLTDEALKAWINRRESDLFVTLFNARHLGGVNVTKTGNTATLNLLTIRDLTRRRGIAKNLLREVEKQLLSEGIEKVTMDVSTNQTDLKPFLIAQSYQITENQASKNLAVTNKDH